MTLLRRGMLLMMARTIGGLELEMLRWQLGGICRWGCGEPSSVVVDIIAEAKLLEAVVDY